jgi:cytochrome P450
LKLIQGPIVRIAPDQLHVLDSEFYETLHSKSGRVEKWNDMARRFGNENIMFATTSDSLHRARRGVVSHFFSRQRIVSLQSVIKEKINQLLQKVDEYKQNGSPLPFHLGYSAVTEDIIMRYCFDTDNNAINTPGWNPILHQAFEALAKTSNLCLHYPSLIKILNALPESWLVKIEPMFASILAMKRVSTTPCHFLWSLKNKDRLN